MKVSVFRAYGVGDLRFYGLEFKVSGFSTPTSARDEPKRLRV